MSFDTIVAGSLLLDNNTWPREHTLIDHLNLKTLHMSCAALSIAGFVARGMLMLRGSDLIWHRWVRTLPHVVDTLLLVTGIWMAMNLALATVGAPWLVAKIVALVVYVVLGAIALRYGATLNIRVAAFAGALVTFVYIVAGALTRNPLLGL